MARRTRDLRTDAVQHLEAIQKMEAVHIPDHVERLFQRGKPRPASFLKNAGKLRVLNVDEKVIEADAAPVR